MAHAFCPPAQLDAFKGDHELMVDRLVVASKKKHVDDSLLQERALVPFFESADPSYSSFEPLERRIRSTHQHGLKRGAGERSGASLASGGSTPKKDNLAAQPAKHRRGGKQAPSDSEASSVTVARTGSSSSEATSPSRGQRKHGRVPEAHPASAPGSQGRRSPSPPHKRSEQLSAVIDAGKYAGPAFCNSPTPDCLPIPSTNFLMTEAAASLCSQLTL